jgi:hypothetical protein
LFLLDCLQHFSLSLKPVIQVLAVAAAGCEPKVIGSFFHPFAQGRVVGPGFSRLVIVWI